MFAKRRKKPNVQANSVSSKIRLEKTLLLVLCSPPSFFWVLLLSLLLLFLDLFYAGVLCGIEAWEKIYRDCVQNDG
ncbi:hypothetical protein I7I50_05131 [Histoplasma capsulatum G186AR]|uniref:Uncharacterized protein n=1 Tax=Ajellomyces capsulatus TaxID=5037 RepID=A0A8H8D7I4_AJECA|nr:hypothetical protein I7I52_03389 [Histoplasma capsulatum]QSS75854.1 hypothetical protein I7I50_05131 [Histoplasma capsulatum G186AR]